MVYKLVEVDGRPVSKRSSHKESRGGRKGALRRALTNLVQNATRYGGGAQVQVSRSAGEVRITVDDHGPGIPPADLDRVFEPFVRLDASRNRDTGGVGLGLSIARSTVRAHGGDVRLENRADGGLRAVVVLPLSRTDA